MNGTMADSACAYATLIEHLTPVSSVRVFGLDAHERLRRSFAKCGLGIVEQDGVGELGQERVLALRTSHFYDDRLVAELTTHPRDLLLVSDEGHDAPVAVGVVGTASRIAALIDLVRRGVDARAAARAGGVEIAFPTDVLPSYDAKLRKHSPPFVLPADPERTRELEDRIFDAAYKGVTDFVTKWVWPVPAKVVTGWCARFHVSPNTVTLLSYGLTFAALMAFWRGEFAAGLACAWMMTFLDTVDGKLARVTLTTSKLGDVLDHGLDLIHPPFWWAAWGAGLAGAGTLFGEFQAWVIVVFAGYIVGRLLEGVFILSFGQEMFTWRPFDLAFRLVIARRNPNLVLLTAATLLGRPDLGLIAVGIWTLCCILIQTVRIAQATAHRLAGHEISPCSR